MKITPIGLEPGSLIYLLCPAGYMAAEQVISCVETLQEWGFQVKVGPTVGGNSANYFSGTDAERLADLQWALDHPMVDAILCGRGGYGVSRIIDQINWEGFMRKPKWIVGFSDITVLHQRLHCRQEVVSIHGPMAGAFNNGGALGPYVQSLKHALMGKPYRYMANPHPYNTTGRATGELVGGNLAMLAHLIGSVDEPDTSYKILFLEDIGEYAYNLDRMMRQLKRAGKFEALRGLILGGFSDMKDTTRPFGQSIDQLLKEVVGEVDYPVCFDFPISHTDRNYAVYHGAHHELIVDEKEVSLSTVSTLL